MVGKCGKPALERGEGQQGGVYKGVLGMEGGTAAGGEGNWQYRCMRAGEHACTPGGEPGPASPQCCSVSWLGSSVPTAHCSRMRGCSRGAPGSSFPMRFRFGERQILLWATAGASLALKTDGWPGCGWDILYHFLRGVPGGFTEQAAGWGKQSRMQ